MPNVETLIDQVGHTIARITSKNKDILLSKIDLRYAYSQLRLDQKTAEHCNFSILCGPATGTYQFQTGFYGLTNMPADFQKAVDNTLVNIENIFAYLDDILIVTENDLDIHIRKIKEVLLRLEQENLAISLHKCEFAQTEVEWLGFNITKTGTTPLIKKTQAILEIPPPKTLKELRKFMGAMQAWHPC